jgi:hypothetical protein
VVGWLRKWFGLTKVNSPATVSADRGVAAGRDIRDSIIHFGLDEEAIERRLSGVQQQLTDQLAELTAQIARNRGIEAAPLRAVLVKLGEARIPDHEIPARLNEAADQLIELRTLLLQRSNNSSELDVSRKQALTLIDRGDLDGAHAALNHGREIARALGKDANQNEARFLSDEAEIDHLQLAYRAAASKYAEAAALVAPFDGEEERELLNQQARELAKYGDEFGDRQAIVEAVAIHRRIAENTSRTDEIVGWIGNKINLSNALLDLSRFEAEEGRSIEEAIAGYRELLNELPPEDPWKMPRAMAQVNLGIALSSLGGSTRLRDAIVAFREALREISREGDSTDWAKTHVKRPGEQLGQAASRERDVDAIGSDFHAAKQCHERRFDFVRCVGSEILRDLTATFDQLAAS